ncbi:MAG: PRC-barrel domain-containing protein [DPANN group archaeon]|nr:PRC-barrel domain-containing protein [DPANN group archaeon]
MMRISDLYGSEIYDQGGKFWGNVKDIILNVEEGNVLRLSTETIRQETIQHFAKKSIPYSKVVSAGQIVIVQR